MFPASVPWAQPQLVHLQVHSYVPVKPLVHGGQSYQGPPASGQNQEATHTHMGPQQRQPDLLQKLRVHGTMLNLNYGGAAA